MQVAFSPDFFSPIDWKAGNNSSVARILHKMSVRIESVSNVADTRREFFEFPNVDICCSFRSKSLTRSGTERQQAKKVAQ